MPIWSSKLLNGTVGLVLAVIIGNVIGIIALQTVDQVMLFFRPALSMDLLVRFLALASWGIAAATAGLIVGLLTKRDSFALSALTNAYLLGALSYFLVLVISNVLPPTFFIFQIVTVLLSGFLMLRIGKINSL